MIGIYESFPKTFRFRSSNHLQRPLCSYHCRIAVLYNSYHNFKKTFFFKLHLHFYSIIVSFRWGPLKSLSTLSSGSQELIKEILLTCNRIYQTHHDMLGSVLNTRYEPENYTVSCRVPTRSRHYKSNKNKRYHNKL